MKNKFLLPFLSVALLLASCKEADDEIDFPIPQKPVAEQIQGEWVNHTRIEIDSAGKETTYPQGDRVYSISEEAIIVSYYGDYLHAEYTTSESGGKDYIVWTDPLLGHAVYEITSISDSTMTWEMTDSLSQLSDAYQGRHFKLEFRTRVKPFAEKLNGIWYVNTTTKVTYDSAGNIINREKVSNEINSYEFYEYELFINLNGKEGNEGPYEYSSKEDAGKTFLEYYDSSTSTTIVHEVLSFSDDKMVWERKESPTVSYIIEFAKGE